MSRGADPFEKRARELAMATGIDPDSRVQKPGSARSMPAWCLHREAARADLLAQQQAKEAAIFANRRPQEPQYQNSPLTVIGTHGTETLTQMRECLSVGHAVAGVLCADGHLGYAQPVGGVIAYEGQISVSGVGFDIGCGNLAARLDIPWSRIEASVPQILEDITQAVSFGVGRVNQETVEHPLFDDAEAWRTADLEDYRPKAQQQLGTVGAGNHYIDLLCDEAGFAWIGVHFGSRGLGHTCASRYIRAAGGKEGINVPPAILDEDSELGHRYLAGMALAGRYAYAGREWVVERVRGILGGTITDQVHNHHNFAWRETHGGRDLWVVRKGATPAFPGQRGFVGGSMGDDAVILEGVESPASQAALYSTVHGAGRVFGRNEAKRRFARAEMDEWLAERGVTLIGGDLDESPMAYRRLPDVLAHHTGTVRILHTLRPLAVVMANARESDPWKD